MPLIDKETVQRITDAADIVEVVGDYVHLVRRGANYMGLCPFHNERTPSFSVNKRKNFCYCFSCKQGGSPVNFIMKKEGLSYHEALLHLARKYGIEVREREMTDEERRRQSEREAMLVANEWAMAQMQNALFNTEEGQTVGLSYFFGQRGITKEAADAFKLGYSIDNGSWLTNLSIKAGYDIDVLKKTGLVGTSHEGNRNYDRYRGRVIFPILNTAGKVIGFGGRTLKNDKAKYINSPESEIYKKSNELYGIYQARNSITRDDKCYLVEGYFDVIGMWQSGMKNVVASSGTALTDGQIALIHRYTENITLIYDGDKAGIKAALRGMDMLLHHKMKVKVLLLPDGEDPDSFARSHTPEEFRKYVEMNETDVIRFKAKVLVQDMERDPMQRINAVNDMVTTLAHIDDLIARDVYVQECSRIMNIPEETILKSVVKKRGELTIQWRNARNIKELSRFAPERTNETAETRHNIHTPATTSVNKTGETSAIENEMPQNYAGIQIDSVESRPPLKPQPKTVSPLQPLEKKIMEYCLKYGFLPFCDFNDENGNMIIWNVAEYVAEDLKEDGISFSVEIYDHIFKLLLGLRPSYDNALNAKISEIEQTIELKRKEGVEAIAAKNLSIADIEREEKKLEESLENLREKEITDFSLSFPAKYLANHEDDEIRETVTELIIERHQLSNIYYRDNNVVETDQDRLPQLVPRALLELKSEILNGQLRQLYSELNTVAQEGDEDAEKDILMKINSKIHQRSMLAKDLGERILYPKK